MPRFKLLDDSASEEEFRFDPPDVQEEGSDQTSESVEQTSRKRVKGTPQGVRFAATYQLDGVYYKEEYEAVRQHFMKFTRDGVCTYSCGGLEQAPTTNKWHIQAYFELPPRSKKSLAGAHKVVKIEGHHPHFEIAQAYGQTNRKYCLGIDQKDKQPAEVFYEFGFIRSGQKGNLKAGDQMKERWDKTVELAIAGRMDEIPANHRVQYFSNLEKIHFSAKRTLAETDQFENWWLWGESGVGKSWAARDMADSVSPHVYHKDPGNKWCDGLHADEVWILDDFEKDYKHQAHFLKVITDRYPVRVEIKGASTMVRPRTVIVTSNYSMDQIWDDQEILAALTRRFRIIKVEDRKGLLNMYKDVQPGESKTATLEHRPRVETTTPAVYEDGSYSNTKVSVRDTSL